ncbi:hypothetical protein H5410_056734 [Solanum commersonii]|uniref:Uncharacterized protein n=1 Tax=Solanum commersonii TaxID=4109 RepID=A0A9J5WNJ5_SOLCO|nr:hypothetical protein H5410_056734 [Solanum commersonii]
MTTVILDQWQGEGPLPVSLYEPHNESWSPSLSVKGSMEGPRAQFWASDLPSLPFFLAFSILRCYSFTKTVF